MLPQLQLKAKVWTQLQQKLNDLFGHVSSCHVRHILMLECFGREASVCRCRWRPSHMIDFPESETLWNVSSTMKFLMKSRRTIVFEKCDLCWIVYGKGACSWSEAATYQLMSRWSHLQALVSSSSTLKNKPNATGLKTLFWHVPIVWWLT